MNSTIRFLKAVPVWPKSLAGQMNTWGSFHRRIQTRPRARVRLRLAAATMYRAWANGVFVGQGPARTAHHHARVDEWTVTADGAGALEVVIEVSDYGVPTFAATHEPAFCCAELVRHGKVLAQTSARARGFAAEQRAERVQRVERHSYQRGFSEAYRFGPDGVSWLRPGYAPAQPLPLARVTHPRRWLPRNLDYPDFSVLRPRAKAVRGRANFSAQRAARFTPWTFISDVPRTSAGFPLAEVEWPFFPLLAGLKCTDRRGVSLRPGKPVTLAAREWLRVDFGAIQTGFPALRVRAVKPARLLALFDEALDHGQIGVSKTACVNGLRLELAAGASIDFLAFEPHSLQHLQILVWRGAAEVSDVRLRRFGHAGKIRAAPAGLGATAARVRRAAVATFRQNALDIFMDCPSRERAGWLCDSLFTARAEWHLCGDNPIERAFLENYLRPAKFAGLPPGMAPMCYPAEPLRGQFIPNWAMFLVLQLDEAQRARRLPAAWRPLIERRVRGLAAYFRRFENEFGLLEKLESWVFVEWSKANDFTQDVNFPTNMLYAAMLRAAARLLRDPRLAARADRVSAAVRVWSWRGDRFTDHAVRDRTGRLVSREHASEVCQYYAFVTGHARPDRETALWRRLVRGDYGGLCPANAFIGKLWRLELLIAHGEFTAARRELLRSFAPMARQTGTLWEMLDPSASRNHGFTSYVAVLIDRLAAAGPRRPVRPASRRT